MSAVYTPRVGDKVRATLGENVLVGVVIYASEYSYESGQVVDLRLSGVADEDEWSLQTGDGWQFEQVVSVPSKFGAVIRRADGVHFALTEMQDGSPWFGSHFGWATGAQATQDGFTVLFDGVDE